MSEKNISQEFRLKKTDETRNYLIEEINKNKLMSNKQRTVYRVLNHSEHLLVLFTTVAGCVSISAFASSVGIPIGITSSAIDLKFCGITTGIRKYTSTIKKKKKTHDKIALLAKSKLNR